MIESPELETVFLKQGEIYFGNKPKIVQTLLGSCISATFYNGRLNYAGMIHAMFPKKKQNETENPLLYVDYALEKLAHKFNAKGIANSEIEVKLFGGGAVIDTKGELRIGDKNLTAALETLEKLNIKVSVRNIGENFGRKLIFHTDSGNVFMKRICTYDKEPCLVLKKRT